MRMRSIRNRILYTGSFRFPEGDAAAARALGVGKALREAGYQVTFMGAESEGRSADLCSDGVHRYEGFEYHAGGLARRPTRLGRGVAFLRHGRRAAQWIGENANSLHAVALYNGGAPITARLRALCKRHAIPLVADVTEWYAPSPGQGGRFGPRALEIGVSMRLLNPSVGNALVISRALASAYSHAGIEPLLLHPLLDLQQDKWPVDTDPPGSRSHITFAYTGSPGLGKDNLPGILRAFRLLRESGADVRLELCGFGREQLDRWGRHVVEDAEAAADAIVFHGRLPTFADVLNVMSRADVLLLIKKESWQAEVQFPWKLSEYFALGRPVLGNLTGDVGMYLRDGWNAFVITADSSTEIYNGMRRAVESRGQLAELGRNARHLAREAFDYRSKVDVLARYFEELRPIQSLFSVVRPGGSRRITPPPRALLRL